MDVYEIPDPNEKPHKKTPSAFVWNVLTIIVLVTMLCVVSAFLLIFINPYSSINPFPPPTLYPSMVPATVTVTPRFTLVPSWTPTNMIAQPSMTPEAIHIPESTAISPDSTSAMEVISTAPAGGFSFVPRQGSPSAIDGTSFHPDVDCNWSGVAGQATSLNGEGVQGLFVQLGGAMPGVESIDKLAMTGLAPQYGAGGFEFTISDKPVTSTGTLWIQLFDQQNITLSDKIYFDTFEDCQKNLIIIYFDQVK
jgi:hypothetical protein